MFTAICFMDDFSDFEGFLMPSIGRHTQKNVTVTPTVHECLAPNSWGAEENDMSIQHTEKKENSSSKRYEMTKLSFGDAIFGD